MTKPVAIEIVEQSPLIDSDAAKPRNRIVTTHNRHNASHRLFTPASPRQHHSPHGLLNMGLRRFSRAMNWIVPRRRSFLVVLCVLFAVNFARIKFSTAYRVRVIGGGIQKDYSTISGPSDLTHDTADQCLRGPNDKLCSCDDPLVPKGRPGTRHWQRLHHMNKDEANSHEAKDVDVVFLGDSITEHWKGTNMGFPRIEKSDVPPVFEKLFTVDGGGKFEGIPLGISGDTSPNLLWRIQNGEVPKKLNPPVFWLLIGTNDFGNTWCSTELVLVGILRVIEELRLTKPSSTIVVNGIFPRTYQLNGYVDRHVKWPKKGRRGGPSLWVEIQKVNEELRRYSMNHEDVIYVDSSEIFFVKDSKGKDLQIDEKLMGDFLHPTALGYKLWGKQIVGVLEEILHK